jgi:D-alanyl-D-alanine carboxypeptidase
MGALAGQRFTVEHLLYASMLVSGNDAAQALAEYGGGLLLKDTDASVEAKTARFVEEMNATARRLGLKDTQYKDPVGLDDLGRSTALDLAKLAGSLNQDPILSRMIGTATITVTDQSGRAGFDLKNSNRLIAEYDYPGSLGGKTGFTPDAGHCLISSAKRDGHTLTAVILKTSDEKNEASAVEARKLLDLGFSLTSWR